MLMMQKNIQTLMAASGQPYVVIKNMLSVPRKIYILKPFFFLEVSKPDF